LILALTDRGKNSGGKVGVNRKGVPSVEELVSMIADCGITSRNIPGSRLTPTVESGRMTKKCMESPSRVNAQRKTILEGNKSAGPKVRKCGVNFNSEAGDPDECGGHAALHERDE